MQHRLSHNVYRMADIYTAYNVGMEWAITILEVAEGLSLEGRRYLIQELRKDIAWSSTIPRSACQLVDKLFVY
jgi:hypothetical protein